MTDGDGIVLDYHLDAPPARVWRAISTPALRERWLPAAGLVDPDPVTTTPGESIRYRMRDAGPPPVDSHVTFRLMPAADGGTRLRIVHQIVRVANDNDAQMRAA